MRYVIHYADGAVGYPRPWEECLRAVKYALLGDPESRPVRVEVWCPLHADITEKASA
jgi:hypothetical protein